MGAADEKTHEKEVVMNLEDYIKHLDPDPHPSPTTCSPPTTQCAFFKGGYRDRFTQVLSDHGIGIW